MGVALLMKKKEKKRKNSTLEYKIVLIQLALIAFLATTSTRASHFGYDAPLYNINPRLISQSVQLKEIPTKVIRITKTVAVKVPVPYPVKVSDSPK